jgi:histidyl-tRNA synthetase
MSIPIPPGVFDILPVDPQEAWRNSYLWNYVEDKIRETTRNYGYQEIRTPIFERTELFQRGVGETSDIVSKEMYTFEDKGGRLMSLRPEGTAPVIRSFIENQLHQVSPVHKLFYISPMFRYERTQAGRYRQHHQFGAEAIGNGAPEQDVELIDLIYTLYQRLGLKNLQLYINSLGDVASRIRYREALQSYLRNSRDQLSADSQARLEVNPLRILDSKDPKDKQIAANAPSILDFLNDESRDHFEAVKKCLDNLKIPYQVNSHLVRGLDYYNKTVFEIVAGELGAQNSVAGGGRYDGLMKSLGGPDLPTMGFGAGLERIIQTMLKQNVPLPAAYRPQIFLIPLGEKAKEACFSLLHFLREHHIPSEMDFSGKKLNKVMQYANQIQAQFVAVIGDQEIEAQEVELKEMATGNKSKVPLLHLPRILELETKEKQFVDILNELMSPYKNSVEADFFIKKLDQKIDITQNLMTNLNEAMERMKGIIK